MLHEILIGLAGHPSPLFAPDTSAPHETFPGLTEAEKSLLKVLSALALANRFLRRHTLLISKSHPSVVCRAVAAAIQGPHLARFQRHILDIEKKVLRSDAGLVGAYNNVPLAALVAEFEPWQRPMEWYCKVAVFMQAPDNLGSKPGADPSHGITPRATCSAAQLIDRLRAESRTGFSQIERVALELNTVAETAWLRQVSSWVLYGKLPPVGSADFFVMTGARMTEHTTLDSRPSSSTSLNHTSGGGMSSNFTLVPKFVSLETSESIFALGRTLHSVRLVADTPTATHIQIVPEHSRILAQLEFPLSDTSLAGAISRIRQSFSLNVLRHLLPLPRIRQLLDVFHEFFLLSRGEFAICLVAEADKTLRKRNKLQPGRFALAPDIVLRDVEIPPVLARTWTAMLAFVDNDGIGDPQLDFARYVLSLEPHSGQRLPAQRTAGIRTPSGTFVRSAKQPKHFHEPPSFHDLLLNPTPVALAIRIPSPLDLFIGEDDVRIYCDINAYLLSIRRAHIRLSGLWRQSFLRRTMSSSRSRFTKRLQVGLRLVWATCSTGVFVLSGMMEYFSDSVVRTGWTGLMGRIEGVAGDGGQESTSSHDPEAMMVLHREFLQSLYLALLLDDRPFTSALHALLCDIDALVGAITRLEQIVSQVFATMDPDDEGGDDDDDGDGGAVGGIFANDLVTVQGQLERDRRRVQDGIRLSIQRLKKLSLDGREGSMTVRLGGIERLLMRLHLAGADADTGGSDLDGDGTTAWTDGGDGETDHGHMDVEDDIMDNGVDFSELDQEAGFYELGPGADYHY